MSTASSAEKSVVNGIRTGLGVSGVIAVIAGAIIVWQPLEAAVFVTIVIAIYAIAAGLVYAGLGIFTTGKGGWARIGNIVLGILFIIAGVIALFNLQATTVWLALFIGVLVGIMWIVEGIVSLTSLADAASKGWTIFFAIISVIAGIFLLFNAIAGTAILWLLLGISLIVLGIIQIVRAFTFKPVAI